MRCTKILLFSFFLLSSPVQSEIKNMDEDSFVEISQKLSEIDQRLKDNRIYISSAVFVWKELDQFRSELLFTVAHDPFSPFKGEIPAGLHPTYLTQKLKDSWAALELSVLEKGDLGKSQEWISLKLEVEQFFKLRDEFLYQPARMIIKSGLLMAGIQKVKETASKMVRDSNALGDVGVKVIDPVVEKLTSQLKVMSKSLKKLIALKTPPPVAPPTIYKPELLNQLSIFGFAVFSFTLLLVVAVLTIKTKNTKKRERIVTQQVNKTAFNYYNWLKGLEIGLQNLKKNEDTLTEQMIDINGLYEQLNEARKHFNESDNQQEYYKALESLNLIVPKIEEHLRNINVKKHSIASRKIIGQVIQLCDAIENKKEINLDDEKPTLRFIKLETTLSSKKAG